MILSFVLLRYLRDGLATTKSDVYAFGVVLFEMVSGKEAMTRSAERRSLVSIVSRTNDLYQIN